METGEQFEGVSPRLLEGDAADRAHEFLGKFFPELHQGEQPTYTTETVVAAVTYIEQTVSDCYRYDNPKKRLADLLPVLIDTVVWGVNLLDIATIQNKHFLYYTDELHKLIYYFSLRRPQNQTLQGAIHDLDPDTNYQIWRDLNRRAHRSSAFLPRIKPVYVDPVTKALNREATLYEPVEPIANYLGYTTLEQRRLLMKLFSPTRREKLHDHDEQSVLEDVRSAIQKLTIERNGEALLNTLGFKIIQLVVGDEVNKPLTPRGITRRLDREEIVHSSEFLWMFQQGLRRTGAALLTLLDNRGQL